MKIQWSLIAGLIFALLTAIFAVINVDPVQVNFGFDVVNIPLILVILGCALIGGIIVGSYGIFRQYKLQKQIKSLNAELTKLRDADTSLDSFNTDNDGLTGGLN
ncbi:lipopolysaccharide assembly protein LapA domain-containing protein [Paenibacillus sp. FSL R5-0744]|uniref:LapA family protein n=1 Tax=Paenibacillus sp. FSL R5-0744 TaxID=2921656 RepID=UPI0030D7E4E1